MKLCTNQTAALRPFSFDGGRTGHGQPGGKGVDAVSSGRGLELGLRAAPAAPNTGRFVTQPSRSPSAGCVAASADAAGTHLCLRTEASPTGECKRRTRNQGLSSPKPAGLYPCTNCSVLVQRCCASKCKPLKMSKKGPGFSALW